MSTKTASSGESRMAVPTVYPPEASAAAAAPLPVSQEVAEHTAAATSAPVQAPPAEVLAAAATVWNNGKLVTGLWSNNSPLNSYMNVGGIGWKKLSNATDSGNVALTVLASSARTPGSTINYRDEADGMVHEIYLW